MKTSFRILAIASAVLALASCEEKGPAIGSPTKISATISGTNEEIKSGWTESDLLQIFADTDTKGGQYSTYFNGPKATFEGKYLGGTKLFGFYPYGAATFDGTGYTMTLPSTGILAAECYPLAGSGNYTDGVTFEPVFGVLKIHVDGSGVISKIKVEADKPLAGEAYITTEGDVTITSGSGIELTVNATVVDGQDFSVIVPAQTYANITVTVVGARGDEKAVEINNFTVSKTETATATAPYSAPIELSALGAANCYLVAKPGLYYFLAKKVDGTEIPGSDAKLLWTYVKSELNSENTLVKSESAAKEDNEEYIIRNIAYNATEGSIQFEATGNTGNAVIALVNSSNQIVWSWHIWANETTEIGKPWTCGMMNFLVESSPNYVTSLTWADRNLGATSTTAGDVYAIGCCYQWGRKDPFLNTAKAGSLIADFPVYINTVDFPDAGFKKGETAPTMAESAASPMTIFVQAETWASDITDAAWGDKTAPFGTEVTTNHHVPWLNNVDPVEGCLSGARKPENGKSNTDPCPPGYRVPTIEEYGISFQLSDKTYTYFVGSYTKTRSEAVCYDNTLTGTNGTVFMFPNAPWWNAGTIAGNGTSHAPYYWVATVSRVAGKTPFYAYRYLFGATECRMDTGGPVTGARAVRCIKER